MDLLYSLGQTLKDARSRIVEGTVYTNVAEIVQQLNQVIIALNGTTFQTGGIGLLPIRNWNFQFGTLGTTLLNLDANYIENARAVIDELSEFVDHVCVDEMVRESPRNGIAPQSNALRQLAQIKFRLINYNNESKYITNWNLQARRKRTKYLLHRPNIFTYRRLFNLTRSQPAHNDLMGTMWIQNGSEVQVVGFDSQCAQGAPANIQAFEHTINLDRVLNNATISLIPGANKLDAKHVAPSADGATYWSYNPITLTPVDMSVEFLLNGQIITVVQGIYGTIVARNFDSIRIRFSLRRPAAMTPNVQALFPAAAPYPYQAVVGVTLNIESAECESVLSDAEEPYYADIVAVRHENQIPVGNVFPPGMNWDELLRNYSASREDNFQRMMTAASIRSMVAH
uniref:Intermediate capsid protein VP6 n=1 Tax=Rotavirus A TaxID=28875 RepID=A0A650D7A2_9REOV|nr:VP6 [Rotavirus A]